MQILSYDEPSLNAHFNGYGNRTRALFNPNPKSALKVPGSAYYGIWRGRNHYR